MIDYTLNDRHQKEVLEQDILKDIKTLDKSDLTGTMKVWSSVFVAAEDQLEAHDLRNTDVVGGRYGRENQSLASEVVGNKQKHD